MSSRPIPAKYVRLPARCVWVLALVVPGSVAAQEYAEVCPDIAGDGVIHGVVQDPLTGSNLPNVEMLARWEGDEPGRSRATSGADGSYALCGLPLGVDFQMTGRFGGKIAPIQTLRMNDPVAEFDFVLSLMELQDDSEGFFAVESAEIDEETRSTFGRVFSASIIRERDLEGFPTTTLYDVFRQHQRLRIERRSGGEVILFTGRTGSGTSNLAGVSGDQTVKVFIDERETPDAIPVFREMTTDDVRRIEILSATEASSRYGGDGWLGAIAIQTRRD